MTGIKALSLGNIDRAINNARENRRDFSLRNQLRTTGRRVDGY